jgi:hypothetical protein
VNDTTYFPSHFPAGGHCDEYDLTPRRPHLRNIVVLSMLDDFRDPRFPFMELVGHGETYLFFLCSSLVDLAVVLHCAAERKPDVAEKVRREAGR